jgi:hypothetical protein
MTARKHRTAFRVMVYACVSGIAAIMTTHAQAAERTKVEIWDCEALNGSKSLDIETKIVKQGRAAVRWRNHPQNTGFSIPHVPKDWSHFNLLRLWIHNAESVPTRFMIIVASENPSTEGSDYWSYGIKLDFTGWKELILPVGRNGGTRSPRGWDQIDGITFTASGWSNTPHSDADVVIDDIRLEYDPPRPGPRMTDQQFFDELDLTRTDLREVRLAVESGDLSAAKNAFLKHMRQRQTPRWRFDWRDRPQTVAPLTGGSEGWDYYATRIKVDWTGWKQITIPLSEWNPCRKPIGWHWISGLAFSSTYGDRTPSRETVLALDAVELTGDASESLADFESPKEFELWRYLQPTTDYVKQGAQAGLWSDLPNRPGLSISEIPHDWTGFTALRFWAYSAKATGDTITLTADSDTPHNIASADRILDHCHSGHFLGDDIDWESNKYDPEEPAFTREWTYSLNRFGDWRTLGRAYWATGQERYAKEWIAQMRDWVEDNPYLLFGTGNSTLTWRTIEAGIRTSGPWPDCLNYFLGSPSLTPDDLVIFTKSWIEHAHHLMRITVDYPSHGGNWVTMECNGLGHLGILLPECKDAPLWLKPAVDRLLAELDRQVYPDGAQKELTTGYHQVALHNFMGLYRIAEQNEIALPKEYLARIERLYEYNLKAMTPEKRLPPLNDARYTHVGKSLQEGAELFDRADFQWAATGGIDGTAPDYTSVTFPYAGQYVMRSGWDSDDCYLLFESGPFGIGHQHEDKLSLFAYGLGRVLLTEAGTYSYDRSQFRRYVLGTWAHNTVLVDGNQQHRSGLRETYETDEPLDNLWVHNGVFDAADGVYQSGYGRTRDTSVMHERTVIFVRPDYWVVLDRLHTTTKHTYDILWHLNNDAAEQDRKTKVAWGTDAGVANLMVTPVTTGNVELDLEIVKGRQEPVLGFAPASTKEPIPVLDYRATVLGPATFGWILTPYRTDKPTLTTTLAHESNGTRVTVSHERGTDSIFIAERGKTATITLGTNSYTGHVAVVRSDRNGIIISSATD